MCFTHQRFQKNLKYNYTWFSFHVFTSLAHLSDKKKIIPKGEIFSWKVYKVKTITWSELQSVKICPNVNMTPYLDCWIISCLHFNNTVPKSIQLLTQLIMQVKNLLDLQSTNMEQSVQISASYALPFMRGSIFRNLEEKWHKTFNVHHWKIFNFLLIFI